MADLLQKHCPKCGLRALRIDRDKLGMRHCPDDECGETWYPAKKTAEQIKAEDAKEEEGSE